MKLTLLKKYSISILVFFLIVMSGLALIMIFTVQTELTGQFETHIASASRSVQLELKSRSTKIGHQLSAFSKHISGDSNFRFYTVQQPQLTNREIVYYASKYMNFMGLQILDITDRTGTVISSGKNNTAFGNDYRNIIYPLKQQKDTLTLCWIQDINQRSLYLTRLDSVQFGRHTFYLLGGVEVTPEFLSELRGDVTDIVAVQLTDTTLIASPGNDAGNVRQIMGAFNPADVTSESPDGKYSIRHFSSVLISNQAMNDATFYIFHQRTTFVQLVNALKNDIIWVMATGLALAVLIALLLALTVTRPLKKLTDKAGALTLENLDVDFDVHRSDEVGILNDALDKMLRRLRQNRVEISAAEEKAAFADIARQVNHDIKNGFIPIRNVMQHLEEVSRENPEQLPKIFEERKATITESLDYLEKLARRYSRLRLHLKPTLIDVNKMIGGLLKNYENISNGNIHFKTVFDERQPFISADAIQLRRAFENILRNAIEALNNGGTITVSTEVKEQQLVIRWSDDGTGIPEAIREQLFTAAVTTKPEGSGIGLANVKRIIDGFDGSVSIASRAPHGTEVIIVVPISRLGDG